MSEQDIIKKHDLIKIKNLTSQAILCKQSDRKVILKIKKDKNHWEIKKAKFYLDYINQKNPLHTIFPQHLYVSDDENYVILDYIYSIEPLWSEHDGNLYWGGSDIDLEYLKLVRNTFEDLKNIGIPESDGNYNIRNKEIINAQNLLHKNIYKLDKWYFAEIPYLRDVKEMLRRMVERSLIDEYLEKEIIELIEKNFYDFFSQNLVISNFDFYPRNLLLTNGNKLVMVDWDRAGLEVKERMLMYFWSHMFGNTGFQDALLQYCKRDRDFNRKRYRIGLLLALLENIELWWETKRCTKAFNMLINYFINYKRIIS